jgi:hypothetical protein
MTADEFFRLIDADNLKTIDRAMALLWFIGHKDASVGANARTLCDIIERHGHPKQNVSRLNDALAEDKRTSKAGSDGWKLLPRVRRELDARYAQVVAARKDAPATDTVLPRHLFEACGRKYLEKVVYQLNASYDQGLYDCCAVMCRRLLETLIIEVYEAKGRAAEIKGNDGHFFMFAGLLGFLEKDTQVNPSRNAMKGLRDIKALGDLAAHNRRFVAEQDDINRVRDNLRVASGELLVLAGLDRTAS